MSLGREMDRFVQAWRVHGHHSSALDQLMDRQAPGPRGPLGQQWWEEHLPPRCPRKLPFLLSLHSFSLPNPCLFPLSFCFLSLFLSTSPALILCVSSLSCSVRPLACLYRLFLTASLSFIFPLCLSPSPMSAPILCLCPLSLCPLSRELMAEGRIEVQTPCCLLTWLLLSSSQTPPSGSDRFRLLPASGYHLAHLLRRPPNSTPLPPWDPADMRGPEPPHSRVSSRTKTRPPSPTPLCHHLCSKPKLRSQAWVFRRPAGDTQDREGVGGGLGPSGKEGHLDLTFGEVLFILPAPPPFFPLPLPPLLVSSF